MAGGICDRKKRKEKKKTFDVLCLVDVSYYGMPGIGVGLERKVDVNKLSLLWQKRKSVGLRRAARGVVS
jgi:hypothetical protein